MAVSARWRSREWHRSGSGWRLVASALLPLSGGEVPGLEGGVLVCDLLADRRLSHLYPGPDPSASAIEPTECPALLTMPSDIADVPATANPLGDDRDLARAKNGDASHKGTPGTTVASRSQAVEVGA